jgi:hypothetical protein
MKVGRPDRLRAQRYEAIAKAVDSLEVDGVLRYPAKDAPSRRWFLSRCWLNEFLGCVRTVDGAIVLLRLR